MSEKKILVIDDDQDFCNFIKLAIEENDCEACIVSDVKSFYKKYVSFKPDAIFLDLLLPKIDGIELIRFLKTVNCKCPIVIVSMLAPEIVRSAARIGELLGLNILSGYRKPIKIETIHKLINELRTDIEFSFKALYDAVRNHEFILHYQPKISLHEGNISGAEALIRWQSKKNGLIGPDRFIHLIERHGLIKKITLMAFEQALMQYAQLIFKNDNFVISINISAKLLGDLHLPDQLEMIAKQYKVRPQNICLELTETALIENPLNSIDILTRLRLKNFMLSVDDFGKGFSSLAILQYMPFNELKIDKSFIIDIEQSRANMLFVKNLIAFAKGFGLKITAEGVETKEALGILMDFECEHAQGYLFAHPMPLSEFRSFTRNFHFNQLRKII